MTITESKMYLAGAVLAKPKPKSASWAEHLKSLIDPLWRLGEFDFEALTFTPNPDNPHTNVFRCSRTACTVLINQGNICPSCRIEFKKQELNGLPKREWLLTPRIPRLVQYDCTAPNCPRTHRALGLCASHLSNFITARTARNEPSYSVESWKAATRFRPLAPAAQCIAGSCNKDQSHNIGLCPDHAGRWNRWRKAEGQPFTPDALALWIRTAVEPVQHAGVSASIASLCMTPFLLLEEPIRWEFLYAVQQREKSGRTVLEAFDIRSTYLALRRDRVESIVGAIKFAQTRSPEKNGLLQEWQRLVDEAHRNWSGIDTRDPRVIHLQDLELRRAALPVGPNTTMNLSGIEQDWIVTAITTWARSAIRGAAEMSPIAAVWTVADEVLRARGTPTHALGIADIDAVVRAIRLRWTSANSQSRHMASLQKIVDFARSSEELESPWNQISSRFRIDKSRHVANGSKSRAQSNGDEPFRFVPQPIVDWLSDHHVLIERETPYLTAEARTFLYLQERCGRRTGETTTLEDDCISYDSAGQPYLEWRQGKPPYEMGKRLPIHQETHDAIRLWQEIKSKHGITSKWLFPSQAYSRADKPYGQKYFGQRLSDFLELVERTAPYPGSVEGSEGNLIYFDLKSIDLYSFRHAFAQRYADATDENGRTTTSVEVLQEYMGHLNFNTTMIYFQVTSKRRKLALLGVPPRRLNLLGKAINIDRERDGFDKVGVSLGHCTEPQNVAAGGQNCALEYSCESCPFFLVDPLERDGMASKRQHIRVNLERARIIKSPQHILDHYDARIADCTTIIDGIDTYIEGLAPDEQDLMRQALEQMADVRRRATSPRKIDLRHLLEKVSNDEK